MRETGLNRRATELRTKQGKRPRARHGATARPAREGSGLARASLLREKLDSEEKSDAGISADDRREIQGEIDEVARRNRISARAEDFIVKPRRKGFVFPLVVNLLAIALTIGAVLVLSSLFGRRDLAISGSAASMDTAEGKLLSELKRDSASKLLEKDKAITDFQFRIQTLDKERNDLAANIDEKVKTREADLRSRLQAELDAEKQRLAEQGLSSSALQTRLKVFETERTSAFDRQLAEARKQASAEKAAADDRYKQLKEEYQKSVAGLGEERKRLQEEAQRNEASLRASLEATTKQLESQSAAAKAGFDRAKAELARLEDLQSKAKAEDDRVIGLYGTIRVALRDRRYDAAAAGADALSTYLKDPSLLQNAALQDRRNADLFVAETLGSYARAEMGRASADSSRLLAQAELLASARGAAAEAQAALKAGKVDLAQAKYREALAKVPEILTAHEYFLDQLQTSETAKRAALSEALAGANRDLESSRGGSQSGIKAAEARAAAAEADLAFANAQLSGARKELAAAQDATKKAQEESAQAQARGSAQSGEELAAAKKSEASLKADIADLRKQLADAQAKTAQAAVAANPTVDKAAAAAQAGEVAKLKAEVERLTEQSATANAAAERYRSAADSYDALTARYGKYLASEAEAKKKGGAAASISAQSSFFTFLDDAAVAQAFPGIRDKVTSYQTASQAEILDAFPSDASEIVQQALAFKDKAALRAYYASKRDAYSKSGNALMVNFLDAVSKVLN